MGKTTDTNNEMINKYKLDNTILETYFKNSKNQPVTGSTFPLRLDNRQYCSPTDYQGDKPSCCGYSTAQILESLNWMRTGKIVQFDANQIYAKAKETDGLLGTGGTYPDLAMMKGLELANLDNEYQVCTSTCSNIEQIKRVIHKSMFASVNMLVTKDLYNLNSINFVYTGSDVRAGGHSMVCCGYDEESKMLIMQNHWGTIWGLNGFFLCPYDVWKKQCNIFCWYEQKAKVEVKEVIKEVPVEKSDDKSNEQNDIPSEKDDKVQSIMDELFIPSEQPGIQIIVGKNKQ